MAGVPVGLDFGAVLAIAAAQGTDLDLLSDVLPDVEISIVSALNADANED